MAILLVQSQRIGLASIVESDVSVQRSGSTLPLLSLLPSITFGPGLWGGFFMMSRTHCTTCAIGLGGSHSSSFLATAQAIKSSSLISPYQRRPISSISL